MSTSPDFEVVKKLEKFSQEVSTIFDCCDISCFVPIPDRDFCDQNKEIRTLPVETHNLPRDSTVDFCDRDSLSQWQKSFVT